jgi:Family of unknown function (DUF6055)
MSLFVLFEIVVLVLSDLMFSATAYASNRQREVQRLFETYAIHPHDKCGFHIITSYFETPGDKFNVKQILQTRPPNDTSIVSPSGRFRIHFDTTNVNGNQPFLYDPAGQIIPNSTFAFVDSVARICDHVYHIEVDSLGYPAPPSDSGAGGGNEYDIYIQFQDTTGELYGYTTFDYLKPIINRINPTYASWMVIRNEFQHTITKGIPAIEVTIAHEFHHGIQLGNYGLWAGEQWFYELTSTWMEQVVYPQVKDYYQYLSDFFNNVDQPFDIMKDYPGYERCIFGIFVQDNYGAGVMKSVWTNIARERPIPAIEDAFVSVGTVPSSAFQLFAQQNYLTNYRTQLASQFNITPYPLAGDYPLAKISGSADITSTTGGVTFSNTALRLTEHFYQISDGLDTLALAIVNNNFAAAVNNDTTSFPFSAGISSGSPSCVRQLMNGSCLFFATADHANWEFFSFVLGNTFVEKDNAVFPQPFNPSLQKLKIPNSLSDISNVNVSILSTSGALLRRMNSANAVGKYFVWDGRDAGGRIVSSGIYIYILSDGSKNVVGKIAVVRN